MASIPPPNRRRDKTQLSCTFCRQRKIRCDRQRPCQTCVARSAGPSCTYLTPVASSGPYVSSSSLIQRLNNLENSLMALSHGVGNPEPGSIADPSKHEVEPSSEMPSCLVSGSLNRSSAGTVYVDSAHWTAILDSVSELKGCLEVDNGRDETPNQSDHVDQPSDLLNREPQPTEGPLLLSGLNRIPTKAEIISAVPDRSVVDRHVFRYFDRLSMIYLHPKSFFREYEAFWANPSEVSIMWLSILYSIISMAPLEDAGAATLSHHGSLNQLMCIDRVVQCLILGDYSRGGRYTIEALHHYFILELARRRDADVKNWSLFGLILRIALQMGYHREPSRLPTITPFEGEVRRRLWTILYCTDIMVSVQMGMPRLIKDEQCDIQIPRNILDSDFDENTKELPMSRPVMELTPVLYWQGKHKMMVVMAKITDMSLTTTEEDPCSSPRIKHLDTLLQTTYSQLPDLVKFTTLSKCLAVSAEDIGHRLITTLLLQKGLILLHRRHIVGSDPPKHSRFASQDHCGAGYIAESVSTCINAAMKVLEYQDFVYYESQNGRALAPLKWRVLSSPISHEFLMATSILCIYLYRVYRGDSDVVGAPQERIREIEEALSRAYGIWRSQSNCSRDAKRATDTLGMLMGKLQSHSVVYTQPDTVDIPIDQLTPGPQTWGEGTVTEDNFQFYAETLNEFWSMMAW